MIGTLNVNPLVVLRRSEVTDGMVDNFDRAPLIRLDISGCGIFPRKPGKGVDICWKGRFRARADAWRERRLKSSWTTTRPTSLGLVTLIEIQVQPVIAWRGLWFQNFLPLHVGVGQRQDTETTNCPIRGRRIGSGRCRAR